MENNLQKLFECLNCISVEYLIGIDRNNIKRVQEEIPQIQKFAVWFMEENKYEVAPDLYKGMCENLLQILQDIVEAIQQDDHVLLHDAIAYGLLEYLKLFVEQEGVTNDSI